MATSRTPNDILNEAIAQRLLPLAYEVINDLLTNPDDKKTITLAKRLLPKQYPNSFEHPKEKQ